MGTTQVPPCATFAQWAPIPVSPHRLPVFRASPEGSRRPLPVPRSVLSASREGSALRRALVCARLVQLADSPSPLDGPLVSIAQSVGSVTSPDRLSVRCVRRGARQSSQRPTVRSVSPARGTVHRGKCACLVSPAPLVEWQVWYTYCIGQAPYVLIVRFVVVWVVCGGFSLLVVAR